jgi:hypothetical protein
MLVTKRRFQTTDQVFVYAHTMLDGPTPVVAEARNYLTGDTIPCRTLTWPGDGWWYMGGIRIDEWEPYLTLKRNL